MREALLGPLSALRYSVSNAWADLRVVYSPTSWLLGWLGRALSQVLFFAVIGTLLGSQEAVRYLFIGSAVMIAVTEVLSCVASTTWERRQGTMPLLVASPSRLWPVFLGRSVEWLPSGILTAAIALFGLGPLFDVTWSPARAVAALGCIVVAAVSTYFVAMVLGALVLNAMQLRNVVLNVAQSAMMLVCGVIVPVSFWPGWAQWTAQAIPLTHALRAIRLLDSAPGGTPIAGSVLLNLTLASVVGVVWLLAAVLLLERLAAVGRRSGSIEFAD